MDAPARTALPFDWHAVYAPTAPLEQGDIFTEFPIPVLNPQFADETLSQTEPTNLVGEVRFFDVVVMTQSCDLAKPTFDGDIVLCPHYDYFNYVRVIPQYGGRGGWNSLIEGRFMGACLLNRCTIAGHEFDYRVVDLRRIFTIPLGIVRRFADKKERVRLLPPYREHLAQAFARIFMRVGLPIDISREVPSAMAPRPVVPPPIDPTT